MVDSNMLQAGKVRELCLRLKPILGDQMDQIYMAYCAEDEEGKKQIEKYLELLAFQHMPQKLESSSPGLLPPSKNAAAGEYPLGTVKYADKGLYPFGLREDEWIQHVAILGRSGAGKTNLGFIILDQLKRKGKPFILFDWKRNYRDLLSLPEFKDVEVYTIGRNIAPFTFNPLIPPEGTNPRTWLKKLNEVKRFLQDLLDTKGFEIPFHLLSDRRAHRNDRNLNAPFPEEFHCFYAGSWHRKVRDNHVNSTEIHRIQSRSGVRKVQNRVTFFFQPSDYNIPHRIIVIHHYNGQVASLPGSALPEHTEYLQV